MQERHLPAMSIDDRLIAEAVRIAESVRGSSFETGGITDQIVAESPADLEHRIVERARRLDVSEPLGASLRDVHTGIRTVIVLGLVVGLILGGLAARSALANHVASIFSLIAGLLGVQTLMLLIWLVGTIAFGRVARSGSIGALLLRGARTFAAKVHRSRNHAAAAEALGCVLAGPRIAKWTIASLTHAAWGSINLGMLVGLALLFIGQGYEFRWDSTWLTESQYAALIETIAQGPRAIGLDAPDQSAITASRETIDLPQSQDMRRTWSWMFFGSVITYGLAPRLLLLLLSLGLRQHALRGYRLDLSRPGFARMRAILMPAATHEEVDAAERPDSRSQVISATVPDDDQTQPAVPEAIGPPVIIGLEVREPGCGWPPPFNSKVSDLGIVDGRDDQQRIVSTLNTGDVIPSVTVLVVDFSNTPDRGIERFVNSIVEMIGVRIRIVLTGGRRYAETNGAETLAQRTVDWRALTQRTGITNNRVVEIDLDYLTATTRRLLESLIVDARATHEGPTRHLDLAFKIIHNTAGQWRDHVPQPALLALHGEIAKIYDHKRSSWTAAFTGLTPGGIASIVENPESVRDTITGAAQRAINMLPPTLRAKPKWMAAGALAGAVGCVTAATLISPIAIAALPTWSLIGAAIAAILPARSSHSDPQEAGENFADAVRAVSLFTLILEVQGLEQTAISRILETTLTVDDDDLSRNALERFLNDVKHRFDIAIAQELQP